MKPSEFKTKLGHYIKERLTSEEDSSKILEELLKNNIKILETPVIDKLAKLKSVCVGTTRICHSLSSGKIYRYKSIVLTGDEKGIVGVGIAKASLKKNSITLAIKKSKTNLLYVKDLKIYNITSKFGATKVNVSPLPTSKITSSKKGQLFCQLAGLKGLAIKLEGKNHVKSVFNYYKALYDCFRRIIEKQRKID